MVNKVRDTFSQNTPDPLVRPPAGHSLTLPLGSMPFDRKGGPTYTRIQDYMENFEGKLYRNDIMKDVVTGLSMGISVAELTEMFKQADFAYGVANPDILEIAGPQMFVQIAAVAEDLNIPAKLYPTRDGTPQQRQMFDDVDVMKAMSKLNPEMNQRVLGLLEEELPEIRARMIENRTRASAAESKELARRADNTPVPEMPRSKSGGFLDAGGGARLSANDIKNMAGGFPDAGSGARLSANDIENVANAFNIGYEEK